MIAVKYCLIPFRLQVFSFGKMTNENMDDDHSTYYFVYVLYSQKLDRYYVGYTNDLVRRISEHNRKKGKYTDNGIPWEIKYTEQYLEKKDAADRERYIKSRKSKSYLEELVKS